MNLVSYSPDKFGYYTVGDYKTYSKLEAVELQQATGHFPEWNFNREVFDSIDWKSDPGLKLVDLYKLRARQIRDSYDYVVLMYSGGSDSHNLVRSFMAADCKIDEIATFWNAKGSKDDMDFHNSEISIVAKPYVQKWLADGYEFKFRLIDIEDMELEISMSETLEYQLNHNFSPIHGSKILFRDRVKEWRDIINSGKKLCLVWGADKPQIFKDGEQQYLQFFDFIDNFVSPEIQRRYHQGLYDELFYWTPDMPEIMQQQVAVIRNFIRTCNDKSFYQTSWSRNGYNHELKMYLTNDALKTLLYPFWDTSTFQVGKNSHRIFTIRDQWMWDSNLDQARRFVSAGERFFSRLKSYWANDPNDIKKGVKCHASPRYYL